MNPTFPARLADLLARDPGRPLVVYYDHDDAGQVTERTELSRATFGNWVAKLAGLLEELDVERGSTVLLDLPTHWLTPAIAGAVWTLGAQVQFADSTSSADSRPDLIVCGPASVSYWAERTTAAPVLACALDPLARPFPSGVPAGVHDLGVEVWSQPDAFTAIDPPAAEDLALPGTTQADLVATPGGASPTLCAPITDAAGARDAVAVLLAGGTAVLTNDTARRSGWWPERRATIETQERIG